MGKATVNAKLAMAVRLEVLAVLSLVIAMQHANVLLARETLGQWLSQEKKSATGIVKSNPTTYVINISLLVRPVSE